MANESLPTPDLKNPPLTHPRTRRLPTPLSATPPPLPARYTSPNEEITHVVLGDRALARPELVSALETHPCTPPVVTALWLLETCRAGRMLPTAG